MSILVTYLLPDRCIGHRSLAGLAALLLALFAAPGDLPGQTPGAPSATAAPKPTVEYGDRGVVFNAADGFSYLILRFRVQQLAQLTTVSDDDLDIASANLAVRRMRLRLE
ncbi:MAG: hypothetical protein KA761_05395, partial [Gemmatimonadaceae bacterium]|nr:hypothetical protein [Gemmatimonadaceae bacterium]